MVRYSIIGILALHAALLAWLAARHSPTIHEMAHLPAGICHWRYGMFELYRVNPPLPRMVAALPVLFCQPRTDWGNYQLGPFVRETIPMGVRFAKANGARTVFLFMVARWAGIPFCLLGGWICYRWACELWGNAAGLMALCLWCFNAMILGHGAVVMPDVPAAALGVFAAWRFWKWLRQPSWLLALFAGLALGLAGLCKTTLLVFFILWPVAWLAYSRPLAPRERSRARWPRRGSGPAFQLIAILLLAVYVINLGYAFKGSFQWLGDYRFQSRALSGQPPAASPKPGNRFADTWLARLPVPLPRDYVQGIDCQRSDFEIGGRSYLHGRWSPRGWWYYYLVGLGIKTPLGTLAALFLAALTTVAGLVSVRAAASKPEDGPPGSSHDLRDGLGRPSSSLADELFLLAPAIAILALVSSQTGFSTHVRYAIPALPYLFIWCGKLARAPGVLTALAGLCVAASILESLAAYPHSLSFFNLLVGGPRHGHEWLLDSNGAWGQDLLYLKGWLDRHPEARPLHLAAVGWLDPQVLGIDYTLPPVGPSRPLNDDDRARMASGSQRSTRNTVVAATRVPAIAQRDRTGLPQSWHDVRSIDELGPKAGWYVIDVNFLHGADWAATSPGWRFQKIAESDLNYEYFRRLVPCERVNDSYLIYHITREDEGRLRRELNLSSPHARGEK